MNWGGWWWRDVDSLQALCVLAFLDHDIFSERLEPFAAGLDDGNRHSAGFPDRDVSCGAGLSCVSAANHFAEIAIFYRRLFWRIHFLTSIALSAV